MIFFMVVVYFAGIPLFWPKPESSAVLEKEAGLNDNILFELTVRTWHKNFSVSRVRFVVDNYGSSSVGAHKPVLPIILHDMERKKDWSLWNVNRVTWPRSRRYDLMIPIKSLVDEGYLSEGTVKGTIEVLIDYTEITYWPSYPPRSLRDRLPFEIRLS